MEREREVYKICTLIRSLATNSLPRPLTSSCYVVVDRFGLSLRFCHIEFDKEAFFDGFEIEKTGIGVGLLILNDLRELSFCGPCFALSDSLFSKYSLFIF